MSVVRADQGPWPKPWEPRVLKPSRYRVSRQGHARAHLTRPGQTGVYTRLACRELMDTEALTTVQDGALHRPSCTKCLKHVHTRKAPIACAPGKHIWLAGDGPMDPQVTCGRCGWLEGEVNPAGA